MLQDKRSNRRFKHHHGRFSKSYFVDLQLVMGDRLFLSFTKLFWNVRKKLKDLNNNTSWNPTVAASVTPVVGVNLDVLLVGEGSSLSSHCFLFVLVGGVSIEEIYYPLNTFQKLQGLVLPSLVSRNIRFYSGSCFVFRHLLCSKWSLFQAL